MERPWWMLAFLLPLCCGSTFLLFLFLFGAGGGGILAGLFFGGWFASPWGALWSGGFTGMILAVPLVVLSDRRLRRKNDECAIPA